MLMSEKERVGVLNALLLFKENFSLKSNELKWAPSLSAEKRKQTIRVTIK